MAERLDNQAFIIRVVVPTLAAVILSVTIALLFGLFAGDHVDNAEVLKVIGPAFLTVIGAFAGFLGGYAVGREDGRKPCKPPRPLPTPRTSEEGDD